MDFILDFIKSIGPAIVVFVTVYYMLNQFFAHERFKTNTLLIQKSNEQILPIKLQSYERLSLFLERAKISNLMMRIPRGDLDLSRWMTSLMIALQQEYEHNMVQQIYVSDQLWSIVVLAKDEVFHSLNSIAENAEKNNNSSSNFQIEIEHAQLSIEKALSAIKQEVKLVLT